MPAADLVVLHDRTWQRVADAVDRIEALATRITAERDEFGARLQAAAPLITRAIISALMALDTFDHTSRSKQRHSIHDNIVDTIACLRALQDLLTGTPPETETPTSERTSPRSLVRKHFN